MDVKETKLHCNVFSRGRVHGVICKLCSSNVDKLVSWMSKKQDCTAMSSAEAEYMALSASYAQVMWIS
ncbi:hypothetical protein Tco_0388163 [Tanacetum coccineum]